MFAIKKQTIQLFVLIELDYGRGARAGIYLSKVSVF